MKLSSREWFFIFWLTEIIACAFIGAPLIYLFFNLVGLDCGCPLMLLIFYLGFGAFFGVAACSVLTFMLYGAGMSEIFSPY